ncbi:MAG: fibrillarin-like rRNA/tRNA 2'-O-methyltransferase [archaeon]|jgi:fibrillarin-like pre-rRNA processing protein
MQINESDKKEFKSIYFDNKNIYTKALVKEKVYGEVIIEENGNYYRQWNPFKSKYCAGLKNGLKENVFKKNSTVLYLGSAEGTTVSHVSDIVSDGMIFCIDLSEIAMQKLTALAEKRDNIFPILSDANKIENYTEFIEEESVDVLFQDVSQRNQAEIFIQNIGFLKKGGWGVLSLKTKSISQKDKKEILADEKIKLEKYFIIEQIISIEPFEKEHYLILMRKI